MSKTTDTEVVAGCIAGLAVMAAVPLVFAYGALAGGFVLMKLWGWFVAPQFGLPALTIAHAVGLRALFGVLGGNSAMFAKEEDNRAKRIATWTFAILSPWILLLIGWLAR